MTENKLNLEKNGEKQTEAVSQKLIIRMSSGKELTVSRVMLFPELIIEKMLLLKANAREALGGFSTGVGFWGSPGWAIGGAVALGLVESAISDSKIKKGLEMLKEAALIQEKLKNMGKLFSISLIDGIADPTPTRWRSPFVSQLQETLNEVVNKHHNPHGYGVVAQKARLIQQFLQDDLNYIYNEEEFVRVEVDGQLMSIRWSFVECYYLADSDITTPQSTTIVEHTLLNNLGITFDGEKYVFMEYRYDNPDDAIRYVMGLPARA